MNIFVLDQDPARAAQDQCDKHVVKMVLESAQLLSGAVPEPERYGLYKRTHLQHPCSIWVRKSQENFDWLVAHAVALADEYRFRYGKEHASLRVITAARDVPKFLPSLGLTTFAQAMPDTYKRIDPVIAYRTYYQQGKAAIAQWNKTRPPPDWWVRKDQLPLPHTTV